MKTRLCSLCSSLAFGFFLMLGTGMIFSSCQDDLLEDSYPEWLGSSIYGELESRETFKYTLRMIEDLNYADVLKKTGSKTVFAADDEAWDRFFESNEWGVTGYNQLSEAQKKWIFNNSMLNAPYLGERLSSTTKAEPSDDPNMGVVMRRRNSTDVIDSVLIYAGADRSSLPSHSAEWNRLIGQDTVRLSPYRYDYAPMVHFVSDFRSNKQVTDDDMKFMIGDDRFDPSYNLYLFNTPVIEQDVTCQNGYIHILRDLLVAPSNMAVEIAKIPDCSKFNSFLERYTIPAFSFTDDAGKTVYRKQYFAQSGLYAATVDSSSVAQSQILFDPSWQSSRYATGETFQVNMSAMFIPTNEALDKWWNSSTGQLVMYGYNSWEDVPTDLLARLVNNHMKSSFLGALPSIFDMVLNDGNREQGITKSDVVGRYLANNGIIYVVNKVYTPDSYISVMAPCLNVDNLTVMGWAVVNTDKTTYIPDGYGTYLNSMESTFSFIVPTDRALADYTDPFYVAEDNSYRRISFTYNSTSKIVEASSTIVTDGVPSGQIATVASTKVSSLLKDILDNCIVVMNAKDWSKGGYYKTKGGAHLNISEFAKAATVQSGGNVERGESPVVSEFYNQSEQLLNGENGSGGNGVTMAVDVAIQPTLKSVIEVLKGYDNLEEFANLLSGSDSIISDNYSNLQDSLKLYQALILQKSGNSSTAPVITRSEKVGFLGNYNYTLYAPNNAAMQEAYEQGLPSWDDLKDLPTPDPLDEEVWTPDSIAENLAERKALAKKIVNFIRFHFQDNSVFTDGASGYYKTQSFNDKESVFYELDAQVSSNSFEVISRAVSDSRATVGDVKNLIAREYLFNGAFASATSITSSSHIVIHEVNAPLFFSEKHVAGDNEGKRTQFD